MPERHIEKLSFAEYSGLAATWSTLVVALVRTLQGDLQLLSFVSDSRLLRRDTAVALANSRVRHVADQIQSGAGLRQQYIDDVDMLRAGNTAFILGQHVAAPSTIGTFLRGFTWGNVRQLDAVNGEALARAWKAGAGPGDKALTVDVDSTICETYGLQKQGGSKFTYTKVAAITRCNAASLERHWRTLAWIR